MRRVYPDEIAIVEHVRYLEAGGRMDYLDWLEVRQEHREMLLRSASWFDDPDEADSCASSCARSRAWLVCQS